MQNLSENVAIQLNDTHPAIAVPELMRLLVDVHELTWDEAWKITTDTISYTNHTLLPEALESWPVPLFERLLPRHMQIIYQINARLLQKARARSRRRSDLLASISLIDEHDGRRVRMGHLAFVGSHKVNGVSALHTDLMGKTVFRRSPPPLSRSHQQQDQRHHARRWLYRGQSESHRRSSANASASVARRPEALARP